MCALIFLFTFPVQTDILILVNTICDMPIRQSDNSGISPYFTVLIVTR